MRWRWYEPLYDSYGYHVFPYDGVGSNRPGAGLAEASEDQKWIAWYVPELFYFFQFYVALDRENHVEWFL